MANVQSKSRRAMQPELLEKRSLFQVAVVQDIVENTGKVGNHVLKTVDETATACEAAEATPDALD